MKNKYMDELINESQYIYYAHTKEDSNERELLSSHLELTYKYYTKMEKYKNLDIKVKKILNDSLDMDEVLSNEIYEMYRAAIYYHDIGKINPNYQKNKMNNELNITIESKDDTHAALSARIYIDCMHKEIFESKKWSERQQAILLYITYYFGYIISRHHTQLEQMSSLLEAIKQRNIPQFIQSRDNTYEKQLKNIKLKFINSFVKEPIGIYILCKLLYSCIITSDFYATYEYINENEIEIDNNKNNELFSKYEESELIKNIRKYKKGSLEISDINKLRTEIFLETEKCLLNNTDKDIFYIESPTGSRKD